MLLLLLNSMTMPPMVRAGEVVVQPGAGAVEMSMILTWYGPDFGTKQQLLEFVARYLPDGGWLGSVAGWWVEAMRIYCGLTEAGEQ